MRHLCVVQSCGWWPLSAIPGGGAPAFIRPPPALVSLPAGLPTQIDFRTRGELGQRMWLAAHPAEIMEVTRVYVVDGAVRASAVHVSGDLVDGLPLTDGVAGCPGHQQVGRSHASPSGLPPCLPSSARSLARPSYPVLSGFWVCQSVGSLCFRVQLFSALVVYACPRVCLCA